MRRLPACALETGNVRRAAQRDLYIRCFQLRCDRRYGFRRVAVHSQELDIDFQHQVFFARKDISNRLPIFPYDPNILQLHLVAQTASGSSTWLLDKTPPVIDVVLPPVDGKNGWYVSDVSLSAAAVDAISGLALLEGSIDRGVIWMSFPILFTNGRHSVLIHARDVAGNETVVSQMINVDTVLPVSVFTSHSDGDVVQGNIFLEGSLDDAMSGSANGELSIDGGTTWQAVSLDGGGAWSFAWNSGEVPNGEYVLQVRGQDLAGKFGDAPSITLVVDNFPPKVSLTDRWWIWESGQLEVSINHFPIVSVKVKISDPQDRWPAVVMDLNSNKASYPISWERRFVDGTLAPSGEYLVLAVACDVNGFICGNFLWHSSPKEGDWCETNVISVRGAKLVEGKKPV
jgi:hypothetical protein